MFRIQLALPLLVSWGQDWQLEEETGTLAGTHTLSLRWRVTSQPLGRLSRNCRQYLQWLVYNCNYHWLNYSLPIWMNLSALEENSWQIGNIVATEKQSHQRKLYTSGCQIICVDLQRHGLESKDENQMSTLRSCFSFHLHLNQKVRFSFYVFEMFNACVWWVGLN